jgi:uncharacterized protein
MNVVGPCPKTFTKRFIGNRVAAEHGDPTAQCNLATLYFLGRGLRRDDEQAAQWFRAAAVQGLPSAENNLAFMYYTGRGVPRDYVEAAKWTRRAAERGYALAETDLGYLYEQGKGVPLDYVAAYTWYSIGASGGDGRSTTRMKAVSHLMRPRDVTEAERLAFTHLARQDKNSARQNSDVKASMLDRH